MFVVFFEVQAWQITNELIPAFPVLFLRKVHIIRWQVAQVMQRLERLDVCCDVNARNGCRQTVLKIFGKTPSFLVSWDVSIRDVLVPLFFTENLEMHLESHLEKAMLDSLHW